MAVSGQVWDGQAIMNPATQSATISSKLLKGLQVDDDIDDFEDIPDLPTTRHWIDSPQKARLFGDRPPLVAVQDSSRQPKQVPIWEREERDRQQFLFQAHVGSSGKTSAGISSFAGAATSRKSNSITEEDPALRRSMMTAPSGYASEEETDDNYDIGVRWLIRNHKLLVAGFDPGCLALENDIRKGDILRAVDNVEILGMKQREDQSHEAEELLLGELGTKCILTMLRPQEPDETGSVSLKEYSIALPRCLPAE